MATPDPTLTLSQFLGNLPALIAVLLAWMHSNSRFSDLNSRFNDLNSRFNDLNARVSDIGSTLNRRIDDLRTELKEAIKQESTLIRAELHRVEEVLGAPRKHLEGR